MVGLILWVLAVYGFSLIQNSREGNNHRLTNFILWESKNFNTQASVTDYS